MWMHGHESIYVWGLGAGVRANVYICGDVKDEAFGYNCLPLVIRNTVVTG